jgi:hypothetical protein
MSSSLRPSAVIPTELADGLDELGARTDWAALGVALHRVLAGDRNREQLLAGLDDIETAILTTVLDRLNDLGQETLTSAVTIDGAVALRRRASSPWPKAAKQVPQAPWRTIINRASEACCVASG